jgi:hypothetical protein
VKAAVLSDTLTLLGFKAPGVEGCSKEVCCCKVDGWSCCDNGSMERRRGGFEQLVCDL